MEINRKEREDHKETHEFPGSLRLIPPVADTLNTLLE